ncbi:MAG: hypothetical protein N3E38_01750 [Candidatus Aenigmarchaeota archaeon]|nr:hypothetical protein [Candidatus Aenigmarchaeota archaeon]MCX8179443.1 hypothetical protein [Candidatus Aenigmarchaeota archaeon]
MSNPLNIILEMLFLLIKSLVEALFMIISKTAEFFIAIAGFSALSVENAIIGALIGGVVLFLIAKYVFGISKELLIVIAIYFILIAIIILYRTIS